MNCSRKLYKGSSYELELPLKVSDVTAMTISFYTDGRLVVDKDLSEITLSGDTMIVPFTADDLEYLADGVLRYSVDYGWPDGSDYYDTNSSFVVVTPEGYSAQTIEEAVEDAYESGMTVGSGDLIANLQGDYYTIPEGTTHLRKGAFSYSSVSSITIPDSVTGLGDYAFYEAGLSAITIPDSVTVLGDYAFCGSRLTGITIPDTVQELGIGCFGANQYFTTVIIGSGITTIPQDCFNNSGISAITIPDTVRSIDAYAFASTNLERIEIPDTVVSLGHHAFYQCQVLTSVTLSSTITEIPKSCFYGCYLLQEITIPSAVTMIGEIAFAYSRLTSITFESVIPPILGRDAFWNVPLLNKIYVPCDSVDAYKEAYPEFQGIIEANPNCGT